MCKNFHRDDADNILIIIYQLRASLIVWHMHSLRTRNKNVRESYKQGSGLPQSLRNNHAAKKNNFRYPTVVLTRTTNLLNSTASFTKFQQEVELHNRGLKSSGDHAFEYKISFLLEYYFECRSR
jgi:hypothetical protein